MRFFMFILLFLLGLNGCSSVNYIKPSYLNDAQSINDLKSKLVSRYGKNAVNVVQNDDGQIIKLHIKGAKELEAIAPKVIKAMSNICALYKIPKNLKTKIDKSQVKIEHDGKIQIYPLFLATDSDLWKTGSASLAPQWFQDAILNNRVPEYNSHKNSWLISPKKDNYNYEFYSCHRVFMPNKTFISVSYSPFSFQFRASSNGDGKTNSFILIITEGAFNSIQAVIDKHNVKYNKNVLTNSPGILEFNTPELFIQ